MTELLNGHNATILYWKRSSDMLYADVHTATCRFSCQVQGYADSYGSWRKEGSALKATSGVC